jgi:hypothetical protein
VLKSLIPSSFTGRLLLAVSLAFSAGVYGLRLVLLNDTMGMGELACCLALCLVPWPVLGYFLLTATYGLQYGGHAAPMIVLVVGIILALVLPTSPPYDTQRIFQTHRQQYEQLVDLARKGQLEHSAGCTYSSTFAAPKNYVKFSKYCIKVDHEPSFSVQFAPIIYNENIVYIDDPSRIQDVYGCDSSESTIQQLDSNWFYCWDRR